MAIGLSTHFIEMEGGNCFSRGTAGKFLQPERAGALGISCLDSAI
jgi:hypothetical protein